MDETFLISKYRNIKKLLKATGKINKDDLKLSLNTLKEAYEFSKTYLKDDIFEDIGYFKIKGKEIYISEKDDADFRMLKSVDNKEELYLIKNEKENWDSSILQFELKIKSKVLTKKFTDI